MRVRIPMLSCLAFAVSLAAGEVKIIVVQDDPWNPSLHPKLVIAQDGPLDPDTHPKRTFDIDDPRLSSDPFTSSAPSLLGPVALSPPHYQVTDAPLRLWPPFAVLDPLPQTFLNPLGDQLGDGPAEIGMPMDGAAEPRTSGGARQTSRGNHDPAFAQFVDGTWTDPTTISSDPAEDLDPLWLQAPDATIHSVWRRVDPVSGNSEILYSKRSAGSSSFDGEEIVSLPGAQSTDATLALGPAGEILIVYQTGTGGGVHQIVLATKASSNEPFQSQVMGLTSFSIPYPMLVSRCGRTWIVWTESDSQIAHAEMTNGLWSETARSAHG